MLLLPSTIEYILTTTHQSRAAPDSEGDRINCVYIGTQAPEGTLPNPLPETPVVPASPSGAKVWTDASLPVRPGHYWASAVRPVQT